MLGLILAQDATLMWWLEEKTSPTLIIVLTLLQVASVLSITLSG